MALDGKTVVGVARLHFNEPGMAQFRYMGVDHRYRHRGIATRLLRELEMQAKKRGATVTWFNAREPAVPFYEKCGYVIFDISYRLYGCIPHWKMFKEL
jgi:GNAT superfamily N-acetyltransferase